jgi:hypothetical protein
LAQTSFSERPGLRPSGAIECVAMKRTVKLIIGSIVTIIFAFLLFSAGRYFESKKIEITDMYKFRLYQSIELRNDINSCTPFCNLKWITNPVSIERVNALRKNKGADIIYFFQVLEDQDTIWEFVTPFYTWIELKGQSGYVIVRENKPIYGITLSLN